MKDVGAEPGVNHPDVHTVVAKEDKSLVNLAIPFEQQNVQQEQQREDAAPTGMWKQTPNDNQQEQ